jgi:hypothetical protein
MDALRGGARAHLLNDLNAKRASIALLNEFTANDSERFHGPKQIPSPNATSSSAASKISYLLRALHYLCVLKLLTLMKKYLVLIATVSLAFGACERHPASQLPTEGEGVAKEGSGATQEKQTTPEPSPSGTPKTYFPQNS